MTQTKFSSAIVCLRRVLWPVVLCTIGLAAPLSLFGQADQGSISGVVQDASGAVIPNADVNLTSTDTGLVLKTKTSSSGVYTFSPIKIGNYSVRAVAPGFAATTQEHIHVDAQSRLNIPVTLQLGTVSQSVTISTAPPLLQTESGSIGQVMSTETINNMPLNGRNAMYVAQLASGVVMGVDARGSKVGDFDANGQRGQQNNFILDGVDNNSYLPAFNNQPGFVLNPPPDALAEFNLQTSDYSAELGHSAGAVMNTSVKSGTNQLHGSVWEYVRNTVLDAQDWNATSIPAYHENQFGSTLGGPIVKDKLFFFGYDEANRIAYASPIGPLTVPTALMRTGDFSELLNPALTSTGTPIKLYEPDQPGAPPLTCNGQSNVICPANIDTVAKAILNMYPQPNTNGAETYNNYQKNISATDNTWQWGARVDWNLSSKDQTFARFSYVNLHLGQPNPLGYPLDGGTVNNENSANVAKNLAVSETHTFAPSVLNEFRFGYTAGNNSVKQEDYNTPDIASSLGFGGVPSGGPIGGSLPNTTISGMQKFGATGTIPQLKSQHDYEFLDNLTWIRGNHSLKIGFSIESIHFPFFSPPTVFGSYTFSGTYTSLPGVSHTGYGAADFLLDEINKASISNYSYLHFSRRAVGAYLQDDWHTTRRLTLNLGLRYDNFTPNKEDHGLFATIDVNPIGPAQGTGVMAYTDSQKSTYLAPKFLQYLSDNNITLQYSGNDALVNHQNLNFSPRIGFSYSISDTALLRGGFGIFYSGTENDGGPETMQNYPFQNSSTFSAPGCKPGKCVPLSQTLETGFSSLITGNGLEANVTTPTFQGSQPTVRTPYSEAYNLTFQQALTTNLVATLAYIGNVSRHLVVNINRNSPMALIDPRLASYTVHPFFNTAGGQAASLGTVNENEYVGISSYNSMQVKLQKRFSRGLSFLATYTWAHSLDDASQPLSGPGFRAPNMIGLRQDYSRSDFDIRNRVTFNGYYDLPFGRNRAFLSNGRIVNAVLGGWSSDLQFTAQTGAPFTVDTDLGSSGPNGGTANAILIADPFAPGGTPPASNPTLKSCPTRTRTRTNWYNPCAFANPPLAFPDAGIAGSPVSTLQIAGMAALPYLGGRSNVISAPGYERVNMSIFKRWYTIREQSIDFRVDVFNVLNTPSWGTPSSASNDITGGIITEPQNFQLFTPDSRFFQISGKYEF